MPAGAVSVFAHGDVTAVQQLYAGVVGAPALERTCSEQVQALVERLAAGHRGRDRGAYVELHNWHPDLGGLSETEVWSTTLGIADFLAVVSRGHGYADPDLVDGDDTKPSAGYESAVDALLQGDLDHLERLLARDPTLARATSHWPHRATLLHYATANGVEIYRQVVPANLADAVALVIEHGADVNAIAFAYGAAQRPLGLLLSSGHPHLAGVTPAVAALLRANGAT